MTELASMTKLPTWEGGSIGDINLLRKDIQDLQRGFAMVSKAVTDKKEIHIGIDEGGFRKWISSGRNITQYLDKNVRF